jgi:hypothetical protein
MDDWGAFVEVVEEKFGAYYYRKAIQDLLSLRQENSVEEYNKEFQGVQFQVSMFNPGFDEMFFTSHFINGLKEEIKHVVLAQLPDTVDRVASLARIQQQALEKSKVK